MSRATVAVQNPVDVGGAACGGHSTGLVRHTLGAPSS